MSLVMKNYIFTIRRHYEFQFEAENYEDAVKKLNATISDDGFDDNTCVFEDCDHIVANPEGGWGDEWAPFLCTVGVPTDGGLAKK